MPGQLFNLSRYFKKGDSQDVQVVNQTPAADVKSSGVSSPSLSSVSQTESVTQPTSPALSQRIGMDVLTKLTQRANQVILRAAAKATEKKAKYIDTEHILWGLLEDSGIYQLFSEIKVNIAELQTEIEKNLQNGNYNAPPQFSPRVKKVLELSLSAARALKFEFVSPEHLLLALTQEKEGLAAQILTKNGVTIEILNKKRWN